MVGITGTVVFPTATVVVSSVHVVLLGTGVTDGSTVGAVVFGAIEGAAGTDGSTTGAGGDGTDDTATGAEEGGSGPYGAGVEGPLAEAR